MTWFNLGKVSITSYFHFPLRQTNHQFLYLANGYLFFRCLEKVFEEQGNKNKKEIVKVLKQASYHRKRRGN